MFYTVCLAKEECPEPPPPKGPCNIPEQLCYSDEDCEKGEKCCDSGCGKYCVKACKCHGPDVMHFTNPHKKSLFDTFLHTVNQLNLAAGNFSFLFKFE